MSKKLFLAVGLLIISLTLGGWFFLFKQKATTETESGVVINPFSKVTDVSADQTYTDEAGFTFSYPDSVRVDDETPDDSLHYTLLRLKNKDKEMEIVMKDTKAQDLDSWFSGEGSILANASLSGAGSLDGVSANQYKSADMIWTVAIDRKVLYLISSPMDDYWSKVHDLFVSSFKLNKPQTGEGSGSGGNVIYEAEETIQ